MAHHGWGWRCWICWLAALVALGALWGRQARAQEAGGSEPRRRDAVVAPARGAGGSAVSAEVDRTKARLGDVVVFKITVTRLPGERYVIPDDVDFGKLSLIDKKTEERETRGEAVIEEHVFKLGAYALGDHEVPAVTVLRHKGEGGGEPEALTTNAIPVHVTGVLPPEDLAKLQAPEQAGALITHESAVLDARLPFWWPLYGLGGLVSGALAAWFVVWLRRRPRVEKVAAVPVVPRRPAHEVALEKLDALRRADRVARGELKRFHYEVAEILREYLGARYGFDALEMTTTELQAALARVVDPALDRGAVDDFMARCDVVKFADARPAPEACAPLLARAAEIVQATRERFETGTAAAPGEAA
jgi:hypothetical protein